MARLKAFRAVIIGHGLGSTTWNGWRGMIGYLAERK